MKKLITISVIIIIVTTQLFAITENINTITENTDTIDEKADTFDASAMDENIGSIYERENSTVLDSLDIATILYYDNSTNLVLNQSDLTSNFLNITKPFYLKAKGNISPTTTIYMCISCESFHNSTITSKIKPEVYLIKDNEMANYKSIGTYTCKENDSSVSNNLKYHSIVRNETNTDKGKSLKSNNSQMDTLFSITLPQAYHNNDTVLAFAFTWNTQSFLTDGSYTSNITITYFPDL